MCRLLFESSWGAVFAKRDSTERCVLSNVFANSAIGRIGYNRIVNVDMIAVIPAVRGVIIYLTNDVVAAVGASHPGNCPQSSSVRCEKLVGGSTRQLALGHDLAESSHVHLAKRHTELQARLRFCYVQLHQIAHMLLQDMFNRIWCLIRKPENHRVVGRVTWCDNKFE